MSDYPPPRENVPIFDSTLFGVRGSTLSGGGGGGGGDGLTEEEADKLYLKWPNGQSTPTGETLNGPTFMTSLLQVAGATTMSSTASVSQDLTAGQDIIMTNAGSYIRFPDTTQQTTGFIPLVPNPTGVFTNSNITVNSFGQVTSASTGSGGGGIISQILLDPSVGGIGTLYPVVIPAGGCTRVKIIACSGGGAQGSDFFDGTTMYAGGSGSAGSMAIINLNMGLFNAGSTVNQYLNLLFSLPANSGQGLTASVLWSPSALAYYGGFLPQNSLLNGNICTLYGGLAGGNGSAGTSGAGGVNPAIGSQILLSSTNATLINVFAQGQNGSSLAPFSGSASQPRPTCPMADFNPQNTTLNTYVRGGYSTYSGNTATPVFQGTAGFIITFYA